ncbi:MAG TPA: hypothetical protein VLB73_02690 [Patescibacteria group bacterium]|nr:hypothetical protein [Patescibacteria group bacterium]
MYKDFYATGFLYHPLSQQILLQNNSSSWTLFGNSYSEADDPQIILKNTLQQLFDLKKVVVLPIYTYTSENKKRITYVGYSIAKTKKNFSPKDTRYKWFSFKEITKLAIDPDTKHDIIVGQRVIEAAGRKERGEHTF